MGTNNLQAELPFNGNQRSPKHLDVEPTVIYRQPSPLAAIKLCIQYGGFEYEKQVYQPLEIDRENDKRST